MEVSRGHGNCVVDAAAERVSTSMVRCGECGCGGGQNPWAGVFSGGHYRLGSKGPMKCHRDSIRRGFYTIINRRWEAKHPVHLVAREARWLFVYSHLKPVDRTMKVPLPIPLPVLPSLGGRDNVHLWIEGEGRICRTRSRGEMNSLVMAWLSIPPRRARAPSEVIGFVDTSHKQAEEIRR